MADIGVNSALLPAPETRVSRPRTRLDEFVPRYQFREHHRLRVRGNAEDVYRAIHEVTASEIRFFQVLVWIRRGGRAGPESIVNAPAHEPILAVATRTTFVELAEEPERELVVGTLVIAPDTVRGMPTPAEFASLVQPGYAKAAMNFMIEPDGAGGVIVSTETRVFATDPAARRRFAAYWRVIYPGSAFIRRSWLHAIERRAEAAGV